MAPAKSAPDGFFGLLHHPPPMRLATLAALILLAPAASAQRARPFAAKGDVALVVGLSGDTFTRLNPAFGGIGLRYRATDGTVVGASVGFQVQSLDGDDQSGNGSQRSVSLALWNENHLGRRRGIVSPFLGAGATFRAGRQAQERGPEEFSATDYSVGVGALLGAEVKLARGVTLGAAYTLGVEVLTRSFSATPDPSQVPGDQTSVRVGTGLTDLHLSVYF